MNRWMFCFVCKKDFGAIEPLVDHIMSEGHKLSKEDRAEFRQVQELVGTRIGNYKLESV